MFFLFEDVCRSKCSGMKYQTVQTKDIQTDGQTDRREIAGQKREEEREEEDG